MAVELEFWDDKAGVVITYLPAGDPAVIPNIGDQIDVPGERETGNYSHTKVISRHFYYLPNGQLGRI